MMMRFLQWSLFGVFVGCASGGSPTFVADAAPEGGEFGAEAGSCPGGASPYTYYVDCDGDGLANNDVGRKVACAEPSADATQCPGGSGLWTLTKPEGSSVDCNDSNADVRPTQTGFFTAPVALQDQPFDYDCDGKISYEVPDVLRCVKSGSSCVVEKNRASTCTLGQPDCVGWKISTAGAPPAACGTTAEFLRNCTLIVDNCVGTGGFMETFQQKCR